MNTERYNRQIMLPEIGEEGQRKLSQAKVLVVGVGGIGSPASIYLTGAGVGTIGLVDNDKVDRTNLQRQILYNESEIGQSKALCAQKHLQDLNRDITVVAYDCRLTPENAEEIISQYDIVVDGCDNFATRFLINDTCIKLGKIYIYGAILAFDGQVSVFNYPGSHTNYRTLHPNEAELLAMPLPPKGVMGVTPCMVGCAEATEAIKLIVGFGEPLVDKMWTFDLRTMQTYIISL